MDADGAPVRPPGPPPQPPRPARRLLPVAAAVVALLVVTVGVIVWRTAGGDEDADSRAHGKTRGTFPTAPSAAWTVTSADLGSADLNLWLAADLGDRLVLRAEESGSGTAPKRLAAVDTDTGRVLWTKQHEAVKCAYDTVDGALPCLIGTSSADVSALHMIDAADGAATTVPIAGRICEIGVIDGELITIGEITRTGVTQVARGTGADPASRWMITLADTVECTGASIVIPTDTLIDAWVEGAATVLNVDDGSVAIDRKVRDVRFLPGGGVIAADAAEDTTSRVYDERGAELRPYPDTWLEPVYVIGPDAVDMYSAEGDLIDYRSGETLLSGRDYTGTRLVIGDVFLGMEYCYRCPMDVTARALADGRPLWSRKSMLPYFASWVTDGERLIWSTESGWGVGDSPALIATDPTTGQPAWSLPIAASGLDTLHSVGDGFAAVDHYRNPRITYYPPTG